MLSLSFLLNDRFLSTERKSPNQSDWKILPYFILVSIISRLSFFILFIIGKNIGFIQAEPGIDRHLSLYTWDNLHSVVDSATSYGDFRWYSEIALRGYTRTPFSLLERQNWAFFPLQPLIISLIHEPTAQFIFSLLTFFIGILFLALYCKRYLIPYQTILVAIFVCFSPYSASLSQFRPDSILFMSFCGMLYFASLQKIGPVIAFIILASFSKPNGVLSGFLIFPYFVSSFSTFPTFLKRNAATLALIGLSSFSGMIFMSLLCYNYTGNPFAWSEIQVKWGYRFFSTPIYLVYKLVFDPQIVGRAGWDFEIFSWIMVAIGILSIYILYKRKLYLFSAFSALYFAMTFIGFGSWAMMKHLAASPVLAISLGLPDPRDHFLLLAVIILVFGLLFGLVSVSMGAGVGASWV